MWNLVATIRNRIRFFKRDERGAVFIIVALAMPVIFGAAAASVDMGQLLYIQSELRAAADSAALAATDSLDDEDAAKTLAVQYAVANMPVANHGDILDPDDVILGNWDTDASTFTAAGSPTNAVQVTTRRSTTNGNPVSLYFARLIGFASRDIEVISVASVSESEDNFCILALDPDSASAMTVSGTADLSMPNCGVAVASTDESALVVNGTPELEASEVCVAGGSSVVGTATVDPTPTDDCSNIPPDPLSSLTPPAPDGCDETNYRVTGSGNTVTISPGTYCGGITITGSNNTIIMEPGEYVIDGGGISVNGGTLQDDKSGTDPGGVYIYNTSSSGADYGDISFLGNSTIDLQAPTSGDYSGVLFHVDPDSDDGDISVAGTASTALTGALYAPSHEVSYNGTSSQASSCIQIIAATVSLAGTNETFDPDDCDDSSVTIANTTPPRLRD